MTNSFPQAKSGKTRVFHLFHNLNSNKRAKLKTIDTEDERVLDDG